ncbi:hypothetical protein EVAR_77974_1 [Eumeta japonica]|uniref:Uncharacterized protein n=1 Tax=Eumeta variegata TaxID=151549 RepID=A0A4C1SZY1_EUMVA|nr:hypothetical protein EVAR_77974_1 [Eumeta japonica]
MEESVIRPRRQSRGRRKYISNGSAVETETRIGIERGARAEIERRRTSTVDREALIIILNLNIPRRGLILIDKQAVADGSFSKAVTRRRRAGRRDAPCSGGRRLPWTLADLGRARSATRRLFFAKVAPPPAPPISDVDDNVDEIGDFSRLR